MKTVTMVITRSHFEKSTSGLMVHAITKGVIVDLRQKAAKIQQHSINISIGAKKMVTIVKVKTTPDGV